MNKSTSPFCKSLLFSFLLASQISFGQSFVNGDLEDPTGNGFSKVPPNWSYIPNSSPFSSANCGTCNDTDLLDATGPWAALGIAGNPQSGSKFASGYMMLQGSFFRHEGIQQTVNCLIPGITYEVSFHQAVVKQSSALDQSGSWRFYVDNTLIGTAAPTTNTLAFTDLNFNWEQRTFAFTATAASHTFQFIPWDDDANINRSTSDVNGALRMGIDNISITPPSAVISPIASVCTLDPAFNMSVNLPGGTWSGTGITDANAGTFDPNTAGIGTHEVIYTISGSCSSIADTIDVVVTCPLPVELLTFDAQAVNDEKVALTWTTTNEINNDYFEIERSRDGTSFGTIGTVDGAGNSNITLHYNDFDEDPYNGVSYYRLKQTDFDGTYTYSDIRTVVFDDLSFVNMYPNPAEDDLQFTVLVSEDADLHVHIVDVTGRVILKENHWIEAGESTITLNVSDLASGMYTIRVNTNDENHLSKEFIRR